MAVGDIGDTRRTKDAEDVVGHRAAGALDRRRVAGGGCRAGPTPRGSEIVGIELAHAGRPLADVEFEAGGTCLVVGHEERGLSNAALAVCDRFAYVPLPGKVGSLNVGTAAAIALYEVRRQEWAGAGPDLDPEGIDLDP